MIGGETGEKVKAYEKFRREAEALADRRKAALTRLKEAGVNAEACAMTTGGIWVEGAFFFQPEKALRSAGLD